MAARFRVNGPRVVHETIDDETLIIDLVSGTYFSCVGASAAAWGALVGGATLPETAALLASAFALPPAEIEAHLVSFLTTLLDDGLVVEQAAPVVGDTPPPPLPPAMISAAYAPLRVEKYTDLADLIVLDPVHDVTEAGWPNELP